MYRNQVNLRVHSRNHDIITSTSEQKHVYITSVLVHLSTAAVLQFYLQILSWAEMTGKTRPRAGLINIPDLMSSDYYH